MARLLPQKQLAVPAHGEQRASTLRSCVGHPAQVQRRPELHLATVQEEEEEEEGEEKGKAPPRISLFLVI